MHPPLVRDPKPPTAAADSRRRPADLGSVEVRLVVRRPVSNDEPELSGFAPNNESPAHRPQLGRETESGVPAVARLDRCQFARGDDRNRLPDALGVGLRADGTRGPRGRVGVPCRGGPRTSPSVVCESVSEENRAFFVCLSATEATAGRGSRHPGSTPGLRESLRCLSSNFRRGQTHQHRRRAGGAVGTRRRVCCDSMCERLEFRRRHS
jgi:hypothetical protein